MQIFNRFTEARGAPRLSDAVAVAGGLAAGAGVLLIAIDVYADNPGRGAPMAMFGALVLAGYLLLLLAPKRLQPAGITAIVIGIFGFFGWWWLPGANDMDDVRPFIVLTIVALFVCFVVPRSRGRAVFVAIILLVVWLWALGEIAGPQNAYSIAPVPSPPPNTILSLAAFNGQVTIDDLDETDSLYPLAEDCADGDMDACDQLYFDAPFDSDFADFGRSCGGTFAGSPGFCSIGSQSPTIDFGDDDEPPFTPSPFPSPSFGLSEGDKSFELGFVSVIFGLAYLGALYVFDRRRMRGLATAFVIPAAAALVEGTSLLGDSSGHVWVGGVLTLIAGALIGTVGHLAGDRRFTTWTGGVLIGIGAVTIGLDAVDISSSGDNDNVKLAGPGFIVILVGVVLVLMAYLAARWLTDPEPEPESPDPGGPVPGDPDPGTGTPSESAVVTTPPVYPPARDDAWGPPPETPPPMVS